jgi:hypothetical protein
MGNKLDQALITRSHEERRNNIYKLSGSLHGAKYIITYKPFPKDKCRELVLKCLKDAVQAFALLLGAGWLSREIITHSRKERRNNINKVSKSLHEAQYTMTYKPFPEDQCKKLVLKYLEDANQALTLSLGAGWLNWETNQAGGN